MENEKYAMGILQICYKAKTALQNIWLRAQINFHYAYVIRCKSIPTGLQP